MRSSSIPSFLRSACAALLFVACGGDGPAEPPPPDEPDESAPVLADARVEPAVLVLPSGRSGEVVVFVSARDSSGVASVSVGLADAGSARSCSATLVEGTALDGTWRCAIALWASDQGTWPVEATLGDEEGNAATRATEVVAEVVEDRHGDLGIAYIRRLPEIDYVWNAADPTREGWPTPGQPVVWAAHVRNGSILARPDVAWRWLLDGVVISEGSVDLPAQGEAVVELPWSWTFERHRLRLELDPADEVLEASEANNALTLITDALSIGFYVERGVWEYFREHQRTLGVGAMTFEDWAHRHVARFNTMLEQAVFDEAPQGVLDRVRLDRVTVVDDGALPLAPLTHIREVDRSPSSHPNVDDRTVDMQWGFPATLLEQGVYGDVTSATDANPFFYEGSLLHELGHARYLTDVYGFRVWDGVAGESVDILENGERVAGSRYMPGRTIVQGGQTGLILHQTAEQGLMVFDYGRLDRYSAVALNLIAGHRAVAGNYNEPENIAIFLNDLPAENRLTLLDSAGAPLAGAEVRVYQAVGSPGHWYASHLDDVSDLLLTADAAGRVLLGRNPFADGPVRHNWEISNAMAILRVQHEGRVGYGFLEISWFNLEYWRGDTALGEYEVSVELLEP